MIRSPWLPRNTVAVNAVRATRDGNVAQAGLKKGGPARSIGEPAPPVIWAGVLAPPASATPPASVGASSWLAGELGCA